MSERPPLHRRQFVVNKRLQVSTSMQLVAALVAIGAFVILGIEFLAKDSVDGMTVEDSREYFHYAIAVYFILATCVLGVQAVLVLHRVAGPAKVIEKAVLGMQKGEFDHRLSLRKKDYLKGLAGAIKGMRDVYVAREKKISDLLSCVEEGDLASAKELAAQVRIAPKPTEPPAEGEPEKEPEEEPVPEGVS